jgi:hypothetical protein
VVVTKSIVLAVDDSDSSLYADIAARAAAAVAVIHAVASEAEVRCRLGSPQDSGGGQAAGT